MSKKDRQKYLPTDLPTYRPDSLRISSLKELESFAKSLAMNMRGGEVIALVGPLGAGKTTFVQMLGKVLGVRERITSPTFTLLHLHRIVSRKPVAGSEIKFLVHIDAYRLRNARALVEIGALDYLGRPDTVAVIEWAERVKKILPKNAFLIRIIPEQQGSRKLEVSGG